MSKDYLMISHLDGLLKKKEIRRMDKEFQMLRKKQRFSLRKLNIVGGFRSVRIYDFWL